MSDVGCRMSEIRCSTLGSGDPSSDICPLISGQSCHRIDQWSDGALGGFRAERDRFIGAMKIEQADRPQVWLDQDVGRVPGETRAGDAVLHDVEGLAHHGEQAGAARRAEYLTFHFFLKSEHATQPAPLAEHLTQRVALVRTVARNGGAAAE